MQPTVAVVGAGVAGLAAAVRLAERGWSVHVFDPAATPGGLAGGFQVGGTSLERYYHHLFRSDVVAQRWLDDLGLLDRLEWLPATMGFYSGGRLHPFGTPWSLVRFRPLRLVDRLRLGLRVRRLSSTAEWEAFDGVSAIAWLEERASPAELAVFWRPLLAAKFGRDLEAISMAWLWARFRARIGQSLVGRERLGYLRGGFQQLADALAARAERLGAQLRLETPVRLLEVRAGEVLSVCTEAERLSVDAVVWTPSLPALARAAPDADSALRERWAAVRYHTAVVAVVELERPALPYYWTTIGDSHLPFTVAVEHTRLVGTADYGGRTIVYLGRYLAPEDELARRNDDDLLRLFLEAAAEAFAPHVRHPLAAHLFRAPAAQPIVPPGWARTCPPLRTGIGGLVAANMAQIYPWDRGINYSLHLGERAAEAAAVEVARPRPTTVRTVVP